ncbi:MAG: polysaccharide deacetylase family protein [Monoglobaceae bacterium]
MFTIRLRTAIVYVIIFSVAISAVYLVFAASEGNEYKEEETAGVSLPVLMYHSICSSSGKQGKFIVSETGLEQDLKYISDNGYTSVSAAQIIDFVYNGTPLPEKPILLTFDDGYYNNYCYAFPLLKKYNSKAVISIIGKYTDIYSETEEENPLYSHITWDEAREMCESGLVEIENHSYNSHTTDKGRNGTKKKKGESEAAYAEYISSDIGKLQEEIHANLGYTPQLFAYPFGSVSEASYDILKQMGFKMTLSCEEKVNYLKTGDTDGIYMLGRYLRTNKRNAEKILKNLK